MFPGTLPVSRCSIAVQHQSIYPSSLFPGMLMPALMMQTRAHFDEYRPCSRVSSANPMMKNFLLSCEIISVYLILSN